MKLKRLALTTMAALLTVGLGACKGGGADSDPILQMASEEALAEGKRLLADEKHERARTYLTHAFEVEPNSVSGREALLLVADSLYQQGGRTNLVQAETRYRDFLNRFPTSDKAAYVQFQIANSLAGRIGRADRDLEATKKALAAYEDLLRLYPTSSFNSEVRDKILLVKESLAEHELGVAEFYVKFKMPGAAIRRFEYLLAKYPESSSKGEALLGLGKAYAQLGQLAEAEGAFTRLRLELPDSPLVKDIPDLPPPAPALDSAADKPAAKPADPPAAGNPAPGGGR